MDAFLVATKPFAGVLLALALGFLIGVERGWSRRKDPAGARIAGIRTFALLGLLGGVAGEAARQISPLMAVVLLSAAAAVLIVGYARNVAHRGSVSATTTIVGLITLGIGLLATTEHDLLASVTAAVTTIILSLRRLLHDWIGKLNEVEIRAIARFALIALAILPLLPDESYGPYDAWNPREIWLVVVLVSGLSLAGYAAGKWLGPRAGALAMAAAGAIVSSTAVTAALAARLRVEGAERSTVAAGIAMASAVMLLRVLILGAMLAPFALPALAILLGPAVAVSAASAAWLLRRRGRAETTVVDAPTLRNPFDLLPALLLAGLVMIASVLGRWALQRFGDSGLVAVLAISGMVDVDSAIITLGALPQGSLAAVSAALALAAPVMLNTLLKAALSIAIAGGSRGWKAATPLVLSVAAGLLALPLLFMAFPT